MIDSFIADGAHPYDVFAYRQPNVGVIED